MLSINQPQQVHEEKRDNLNKPKSSDLDKILAAVTIAKDAFGIASDVYKIKDFYDKRPGVLADNAVKVRTNEFAEQGILSPEDHAGLTKGGSEVVPDYAEGYDKANIFKRPTYGKDGTMARTPEGKIITENVGYSGGLNAYERGALINAQTFGEKEEARQTGAEIQGIKQKNIGLKGQNEQRSRIDSGQNLTPADVAWLNKNGMVIVPQGTKGAMGSITLQGDKNPYSILKAPKEFAPPRPPGPLRPRQNETKDGLRMHPNTILKVNEGMKLPGMLKDLYGSIEKNKDVFGPIEGKLRSAWPWDERTKTLNAQFEAKSQEYGKYMEGGVLRKEDEAKYRKQFPQVGESPDVARNKLMLVDRNLREKVRSDVQALKQAGYDTSAFDIDNMPSLDVPGVLGGPNQKKPVQPSEVKTFQQEINGKLYRFQNVPGGKPKNLGPVGGRGPSGQKAFDAGASPIPEPTPSADDPKRTTPKGIGGEDIDPDGNFKGKRAPGQEDLGSMERLRKELESAPSGESVDPNDIKVDMESSGEWGDLQKNLKEPKKKAEGDPYYSGYSSEETKKKLKGYDDWENKKEWSNMWNKAKSDEERVKLLEGAAGNKDLWEKIGGQRKLEFLQRQKAIGRGIKERK